ncbi:hypothetical protein OIU34_16830 [Pararhizobium sp. BT-229]|uniref:hypothetical protein n=1 Tax=Pararhizobium sp. BT-229 TaxID=2986923 RepID=UPI0021F797CC|nr:hypothetical protein [Pararhizobium sp. BT-229]MCV9963570.1 hypothetical protein [Pararhizobium sp. BT-229]
MKITIPVPVTFTTDAPREGTRTALTFVPTEFDVPEAADADAPIAAKRFGRGETLASYYRLHEGGLYGTLVRTDGTRFPLDIEYEMTKLIGTSVYREIEELRVDDLHPRDAKDVMALVGPAVLDPHGDYEKFNRIAAERVANRRMATLASASPDFEARRAQAIGFVAEAISRLLVVGGVRYKKTAGIAISVDADYNGRVRVSEMEMWDGSLWQQEPHRVMRSTDHMNTHYFSYADRDEALAFAQELGAARGKRVQVDKDDDIAVFVPTEALPKQDMRWAELVRSATAVAHYTGTEVARRIRNQEASIFTDDRSLRYAFDRLMEALDDTDAFGEPNDRLEVAARDMLDLVTRNARAIDTKYRNLATTWADAFAHLDVALSRWDDRPLEIEVSLRQPGMAR